MDYALKTTVGRPFADVLEDTRAALADQGFGVLTEIDMAATLRAKTGAETPDQVILGACRPVLALEAVRAEPSVGLLLPCNVVVRAAAGGATVVEAIDPGVMITLTENDGLAGVAAEARERLASALGSLGPARPREDHS